MPIADAKTRVMIEQVQSSLERKFGTHERDLIQEAVSASYDRLLKTGKLEAAERPKSLLIVWAKFRVINLMNQRAQTVDDDGNSNQDAAGQDGQPRWEQERRLDPRFSIQSLPTLALKDLPPRAAQIVLADALGESRDDIAAVFGMSREAIDVAIYRARNILWAWRCAEAVGEWEMTSRSDTSETWVDFAVRLRELREGFAKRHEIETEKVPKALGKHTVSLGVKLQVEQIPDGLIAMLDLPTRTMETNAAVVNQTVEHLRDDLLLIEAERDFSLERNIMATEFGLSTQAFDEVTRILSLGGHIAQGDLDKVHDNAIRWRSELGTGVRSLAIGRAAAEPREVDAIARRYGLSEEQVQTNINLASSVVTIRADITIMRAAQRFWRGSAAEAIEELRGLDGALRDGGAGVRDPEYKARAEAISRAKLLGHPEREIEARVPPQNNQGVEDVCHKTSIRAWFQELALELGICSALSDGRSRVNLQRDFKLSADAIKEIEARVARLRLPGAASLW